MLLAILLVLQTGSLAQSSTDSLQFRVHVLNEKKKTAAQLESVAGFTTSAPLRSPEIDIGLRRVWEHLRANRFYDARLDSVTIDRDPPSGIQELYFHFDPGVQIDLRLAVHSRDSSLSDKSWERELAGYRDEAGWVQTMQEILQHFARRGYPLAAVALDSVRQEEQDEKEYACMYFSLDAGPLVQIDSILIRGNKLTQAKVLLRELRLQPGDRFNLDEVNGIPERLMRLGFLQSVAPPELSVDDNGRYLLQIEIKEANSNSFNGVAGYNPAAGTQQGYFTGLLDVQFNNLFGTGRSFNAHWEKRGIETQELGLRYREPWLFNYPVHISGGFQQLIQDTLYVERKWDFTLEVPLAPRFSLFGSLVRESVSPDSLAALRLDLPPSRVTNFLAGWRYDSRDDLFNPQRGMAYATTLAAGFKQIDTTAVTQRFTRQQVSLDVHGLFPTFWPQVLSLAVHGRQVTTEEPFVSITDQIRFGGATTLRGYREDEFRGSRVAWGNFEYRYLLSRRSRAFVFCDVGYYFREEPDPASPQTIRTEATKVAYGLGVRLDSPVGIVGLDYGIGEGDDWLNGKVHVSLVNSF
ncbi:MAG: BamA/OMP85 family outer membrane protein [bacterium]